MEKTDELVFKKFKGMEKLVAGSRKEKINDLEEKLYMHGLTPFVKAVTKEVIVKEELVKELIATYDPVKQLAKVGDRLLNVNKNALGEALQLNLMMSDVDVEDEENWPAVDRSLSEYGDFLHLFITTFMYLKTGTEVVHKVHDMRGVVMKGHPELFDFFHFMWLVVENELLQGVKLKECFYGPHIQCLIRCQHPKLFEMDDGDGDKRDDGDCDKRDDGDGDKRDDGTKMDDGTQMDVDKRDDGTDMDGDKRNDDTQMEPPEGPKVDTTSSEKISVDSTKKKRRLRRKQSDPSRAPASSVQTEFCCGGDGEGEESQEDEQQANL